MKRLILVSLIGLFFSTTTHAQELDFKGEKCGTAIIHNYMMEKDPEYRQQHQDRWEQLSSYINNNPQSKGMSAGPIYTIPVVVHIMHLGTPVGGGTNAGNPGENISDDQVRSAIDALNRDFRKKPGTIGDGIGVDTEIEFALATKGPSGESYPGGAILRVNASGVTNYATNGISSSNEVAVKALSKWDNTKYYNIWIVYKIDGGNQGGTQGYAYFPGAASSKDGSVILFNAFGTTGVLKSYTNKNRTATHEIGHALMLYHTFEGDGDGSTCPATETNCATQGDRICDIPPHKRSNSNCPADGTANSCKSGTTAVQFVHNYLDYSSDACQNSFTQDQTNVMRGVLATGGRKSLVTATNNQATGTNGQNKPYSQISISNNNPCFGSPIQLSDLSLYAPTSWKWTFNGGSPSSSTVQNPTVSFSGAGPFSIKLVTTNQYGSDSITLVDTIKPIVSKILPFAVDFESGVFPNSDLSISTEWENRYPAQNNDTTWRKADGVSANGVGSAAIVLPNTEFAVTSGNEIFIQTKPLDFTNIVTPQLSFNVAYKRTYSAPDDSLIVSYSTDCGNTFTKTTYQKGGSTQGGNPLFTVQGSSPYSKFTPLSSQWRKDSINLSSVIDNNAVIVRIGRKGTFETTNGVYAASNYLYLDNIQVKDAGVPVANYTMNKTVACAGTSVTFTDSSKGDITTYNWSFGEGASPATATGKGPHNVTYATSGSKLVSLTVSGPNGQDVETKQSLEIKNTPQTSAISGKNIVCTNDGNLIYSVASNSGSTYNWTVPAGAQIVGNSNSNSINVNFNGNAGEITLQEIGLGNCAAAPVSKTITIAQAPLAQTGGNKSVCVGDSVVIGASPINGNTYQWVPSNNTLTSSTSSNPMAFPSTTTKYTLMETNPSNGCSKSDSIIITVNPKPIANVGQNASVCSGTPTNIGANPVSGNTYSWTPSAGLSSSTSANPVATVSQSTLFSLTETITATGCSNTNTVSINILPSPKAVTGKDTTICSGQSMQLGTNPVNNHTYEWTPSTGLTSASISNPIASPSSTTTYSLKETNTGNGCQLTKSITITIGSLPTLNAGGDKTICSGNSTAIGEVSQSGHSYTWTPSMGLSNANISNPSANPSSTIQYKVVKRNSTTGCSSSGLVNVIVNPLPEAYTGGNQTSCQGQSIKLGKAPAQGSTYQWSGGNQSATTSEITVTPITATTYTLVETITASGCTKSNSATVTPSSVGNVTTSVSAAQRTTKVCFGGTVIFDASTSTGGSTPQFQWFKNGNAISGATGSSYTTQNLVNGDAFKVQMVSSLQCKSTAGEPANSNNVVVSGIKNQFAPPTITGNPNACIGNSYTYIAKSDTAGAMYTWSGPNGFKEFKDTIIFNNIMSGSAGSYSVLYSKDGCSSAATGLSLTVSPKPEAKVISDQNVCKNQSIQIGNTVANNNTFQWSPSTYLNDATSRNPTSTPDATITYTLVETNPGTNCSNTNSVTLTVNQQIVANAGIDKGLCEGESTLLQTAAQAGFDYQWLLNGNIISSTSKVTVTPTQTSTYTLKVTDQNNTSCFTTDDIIVTVNPNPIASISSASNTICQGGLLDLTASIAINYSWSNGATGQTITVSQPGTYTVELTSDKGCKASASKTVTQIPSPSAGTLSANPQQVCNNESTVVSTINRLGNLIWQQSPDNIAFQTVTGVTDTFVTISNITTTMYVRAISSASGCKSDTSVAKQINLKSSAIGGTISATKDSVCTGTSSLLTLSGQLGTIIWQSSTDNINFSNIAGANNSTYTTPALVSKVYYRARLSEGTCADAFSSVKLIEVKPLPDADFIADDTNIVAGGTVKFTPNNQVPGSTYIWDLGDGNTSTVQIPNHTYTNAGTYTVVLTTITKGCQSSLTKENYINTTVGVNQLLASKLTIYPNPTQSILNIQFDRALEVDCIEVYDLAGKLMLKSIGSTSILDVAEFDAGTYQIRLIAKQGVVNKIFIKY